ncbi:MAG: ABC transporter permease [Nitrososphaerota archaeon]|nr:ABC transporter permease [Candidatus Bathyarchaeota archaeon]MDW8048506.1 ABC transporter permease [Nitrososphaerota archaeon]
MVRGLANLMMKETKEMLRDPRILVGVVLMPLISFLVMGGVMNVSTTAMETAVQETLRGITLALLNKDPGPVTESLVSSLRAFNATIIEVNGSSVEVVLKNLSYGNISGLIVIPEGFSKNITSGLRASIEAYSIFGSFSVTEIAKSEVVATPIRVYENLFIRQMIAQAFPNMQPENILDPILIENYVFFRNKVIRASPQLFTNILMTQSLGFPMAMMLLLLVAMSVAATSISIEKEEKTLETLLTLPIGRMSILLGKLGGSVVVAIAGAITSIIGVNYYTGSLLGQVVAAGLNLEEIGFTISPIAYGFLAATVFVTLVSALALAVCIAAFSENVRSAQTMVTPISFIVVIPSIILMIADIEILPLPFQMILYAIPYTHSLLAYKAAFLGDYFVMLRSILYISLFTFALLYFAAKIFTTERIVTARISFKKPKTEK